jgi:hypothetical protein
MAVTPVNTTITVTTAGTRVRLTSDTNIKPSAVYFEADDGNTGYIFVGTVAVASTIYMAKLGVVSSVGQGFSLTAPGAGGGFKAGGQGIQLSDLYVDSTVNGEKVQVTYVYSTGG